MSGRHPFAHRFGRAFAGIAALGLLAIAGVEPGGAQEIPRFRIREQRAREFFEQGLRFHNAQQYEAAREFFYKALDVQPYFHLSRRYLGDSYFYAGEWDSALEQWEFLNEVSRGAYPLVRQRGEMLRFYLNRYRNPGDYIYLRSFDRTTWAEQEFRRPVDVAFDESDRLYLLSYESANVLRVTTSGIVEHDFGGAFWDRLEAPLAFAYDDGQLFICDYGTDEVRVFNADGREVETLGGTGSGDGQLRGPAGIALTDSAIFVSDTANQRVAKFTRDGRFIANFRSADRGNLRHPVGLAVGADRLYVADRDDRRIAIFDLDGNYLGELSSPLLKRPHGLQVHGDRLIVADEEAGVLFYSFTEKRWIPLGPLRDENDRPVRLVRPFSARMDASGILYVSDFGSSRVLTLVPRGMKITNLDVKVQRVDTASFPSIGVFLSARNRLGTAIRGLHRTDFFLFENDRRIGQLRADNIVPYNRRAQIVIAKENSEFFQSNFVEFLPSTLNGLLGPLREADELRVVRIGDHVRTIYEGLGRGEILRQLSTGDVSAEPNLGKGLHEAITSLVPELGPRAVVLIVSGKRYPGAFNQYSVQKLSQYAWANGVSVHVISYEGEDEEQERADTNRMYRELARDTGGRYFRAYDETALGSIMALVRDDIDRRYVLTYDSYIDEDLRGNYVDVRVEVRHLGTSGLADGGYFVP